MGSNEKQLALGVGAAVVLAFGVIWVVPKLAGTPAVQDADIVEVAQQATPVPEAEVMPDAEPEIMAAEAAELAEDLAEDEPEPAPAVAIPSFDTFQLGKDGEALIAGRADPNVLVDVVLAGAVVSTVETDRSGAFVAFVSVAPSDQPRTLHLMSDPNGAAVRSDETIIVSPFAAEVVVAEIEPEIEPEVVPVPDVEVVAQAIDDDALEVDAVEEPVVAAVVAPEGETIEEAVVEAVTEVAPESDIVEEAAVETVTEDAPASTDIVVATVATPVDPETPAVEESVANVVIDEPVTTEAEPEIVDEAELEVADLETVAPPVLVSDADGVRVLQPSDVAPDVLSNVALDAITYDPTGEVLLSGRASGEGFVQVYIDNQPVTTSRITADGDWRTDLPQVDTGVYTLRIDEVDDSGAVVSRVETPFKREEPEAVAAVLAEETAQEGFEVAVRTVQPGSTLWAIAREQFGEGVMYVEVFEANRDLIRDPNLIFPGQVFRMPQMSDEAGQ